MEQYSVQQKQDVEGVPGEGNYLAKGAEAWMWGELEKPTVGRQQASPEPRGGSTWAGQLLGPAWEGLCGDQLIQNLATPSRPGTPTPRLRERGQAGILGVDPAGTPRVPTLKTDQLLRAS